MFSHPGAKATDRSAHRRVYRTPPTPLAAIMPDLAGLTQSQSTDLPILDWWYNAGSPFVWGANLA
jgi:hypothetical protein